MARNTLMGASPPLLLSCITEVVTIGLVGKEIKLLRSHFRKFISTSQPSFTFTTHPPPPRFALPCLTWNLADFTKRENIQESKVGALFLHLRRHSNTWIPRSLPCLLFASLIKPQYTAGDTLLFRPKNGVKE